MRQATHGRNVCKKVDIMNTLHMNLGSESYDIVIGKGLLDKAGEFFNLDRRVLVVTDATIPECYAATVAGCAKVARVVSVAQGEGSKSLAGFEEVLLAMADMSLTRGDCVVAVGGGVIGDLVGFAAASYMRGIDFYNVPTTVLSMVDSSIGGKTAINLGGIKNIVGAFHQPRGVLIDTDTLNSLDARQWANGLAEAVKMSLTSDGELFESLEALSPTEIREKIEDVIVASLKIKKAVVEEDVTEKGLRRILNFGHTLGHGIEAVEGLSGLYHGECVALGMLPMCSPSVRERLIPVLNKLGLPTIWQGNIDEALQYATHDKKRTSCGVNIVYVKEVGSSEIINASLPEFRNLVKEVF